MERYVISDGDIEHLHHTVELVLDIIKGMSPDKDIAMYQQLKDLICVDVLKAIQLLGFNYKGGWKTIMKAIRKRIIQIALIIVIIIVIMVNMVTIKPIYLNTKGVEEIFVAVMINTNRLTFDGEATVSKRRDITDVVKKIEQHQGI